MAVDLEPGFNKFEGLLGQGDKGVDARRAEVFGHEGGHALYDLDNPAEGVRTQMLLDQRDAAIAALPMKNRYKNLPGNVQNLMDAATKAVIPSERSAQQTEKIINGELRASMKTK